MGGCWPPSRPGDRFCRQGCHLRGCQALAAVAGVDKLAMSWSAQTLRAGPERVPHNPGPPGRERFSHSSALLCSSGLLPQESPRLRAHSSLGCFLPPVSRATPRVRVPLSSRIAHVKELSQAERCAQTLDSRPLPPPLSSPLLPAAASRSEAA